MELVQKMQGMESNLNTMSREVEKLRADIQNAEKKVQQGENLLSICVYKQECTFLFEDNVD